MARIYQTTNMGDATIRIGLVSDKGSADLLVHRVQDAGAAVGDALWYITRDKQHATARVIFTSIGMAQVLICFVDNQAEAGWQRRGQSALRHRNQLG